MHEQEPSMTPDQFEDWLQEVYSAICDKADEDEGPDEAWRAFLLNLDHQYSTMHVEMHWGPGGVTELVGWLMEIVNSGEEKVVVNDPAWDGGSTWAVLAMSRRVLARSAVAKAVIDKLHDQAKDASLASG